MLNKMNNNKGFTLIELMIVVAIIGILAAIAIPQFAAYRIRGFNSSAQSDVRNISTSEAALFSDWQRYGTTQEMGAAGAFVPVAPAAGALVAGGNATVDGIATADAGGTARGIQIPIGNGVLLVAVTNVVPAAASNPSMFNAAGKHTNGDTIYGVDSDTTSIFQDPTTAAAGTPMVVGDVPGATVADDYTGVGNWIVK